MQVIARHTSDMGVPIVAIDGIEHFRAVNVARHFVDEFLASGFVSKFARERVPGAVKVSGAWHLPVSCGDDFVDFLKDPAVQREIKGRRFAAINGRRKAERSQSVDRDLLVVSAGDGHWRPTRTWLGETPLAVFEVRHPFLEATLRIANINDRVFARGTDLVRVVSPQISDAARFGNFGAHKLDSDFVCFVRHDGMCVRYVDLAVAGDFLEEAIRRMSGEEAANRKDLALKLLDNVTKLVLSNGFKPAPAPGDVPQTETLPVETPAAKPAPTLEELQLISERSQVKTLQELKKARETIDEARQQMQRMLTVMGEMAEAYRQLKSRVSMLERQPTVRRNRRGRNAA